MSKVNKYVGVVVLMHAGPDRILQRVEKVFEYEGSTVGDIEKVVRPQLYSFNGSACIIPQGVAYAFEIFNRDSGKWVNQGHSDNVLYRQMVSAELALPSTWHIATNHFVMQEEADTVYTDRLLLYSPVPLLRKDWEALETRSMARWVAIGAMRKLERNSLSIAEQDAFARGRFMFQRWFYAQEGLTEIPMATNAYGG